MKQVYGISRDSTKFDGDRDDRVEGDMKRILSVLDTHTDNKDLSYPCQRQGCDAIAQVVLDLGVKGKVWNVYACKKDAGDLTVDIQIERLAV